MQVRGSAFDAFRVSISSGPSTSSHGSSQEDCDALGDVYIWGEVISDNSIKAGNDKICNPLNSRNDVLVPKPLEANAVFDVNHIACGVRYAAIVTRQGQVFTWGEESGGRLGHGVGRHAIQPRLVESLAFSSVDFVSCGEFHTCAVTRDGELYTWGDGTHNAGLLGHGTNVSHWIPKRVLGSLEGLQIASVTCGPWHTALVTSTRQLFTFGDGTFGVLGHGDRESVSYPREIESLMGLKTLAVSCGVWHTAAVVEVMVDQSSTNLLSGKIFTWGDGDKNRLGHGDKEPKLKPTCVSSLIDYNFHKIACGHNVTVGLTTSGHVFSMGSTVYGQLGNPQSDGKVPCFLKDNLVDESVKDISCGAYHVAVLTSRNEVYTWGKGANGRLGHGDTEDRKTPTLVEALKDRHVKYIACGSNFTAAICIHKRVSGAEQSQCAGCRQAFGFTRKRHNCFNCGLVHCHSCSSKRALKAALAPNPSKPSRVCDSCLLKLNKVSETGGTTNRRNAIPQFSAENKDRLDKVEIRFSKSATPTSIDLIKLLDSKAISQGKKADKLSVVLSSQAPSLLQLKDISFCDSVELCQTFTKPVLTSVGQFGMGSGAMQPFFRKPSPPPRSVIPCPTTSGISLSNNIVDSLMLRNELLNQEIQKLRSQVDSLTHRCQLHEFEMQKSARKAEEAVALGAEESAKSKASKEVIKNLTAQLKDTTGGLQSSVYECDSRNPLCLPNDTEPINMHHTDVNGEHHSGSNSTTEPRFSSLIGNDSTTITGTGTPDQILPEDQMTGGNGTEAQLQNHDSPISNGRDDQSGTELQDCNGEVNTGSRFRPGAADGKEIEPPFRNGENCMKSRFPTLVDDSNHVETESIEQCEPGVYITLVALPDRTRDLKRVRFSRRRFGEHQAESWWSENRAKVYEKYNIRGSEKSSSVFSNQSLTRTEESVSVFSQT